MMSFPIERIKRGVSPITNEQAATIYTGRVDSEALCVVRDYLIGMMDENENTFGYEWTRYDGKVVELTVKVRSERTDVKVVGPDDVQPVVHGKWVGFPECLKYPNAYADDHIVYSACEECFSVLDNCTERFDYCQHCGARMDLEEG